MRLVQTPRRLIVAGEYIGRLFDRYPDLVGYGVLAVVCFVLAIIAGQPGRLPITLAYIVSVPLMFGLPAFMVLRHRARQSRVMDRLRAIYAMAEGSVMAGRFDEARRKLTSIERWERHWKIGNSAPYRWAYAAVIFMSTSVVALMHYVLYANENSHSYGQKPHGSLFETIDIMSRDPGMVVWFVGFSLLAAIGGIEHLRDLREEPWSEFYSAKLRALLAAGRTLATPRRQAAGAGGVDARELLGLPATFTQAELRRAWLRLVRELHPDRWAHAGEAVQRAKDEALRRVNAARDELSVMACDA